MNLDRDLGRTTAPDQSLDNSRLDLNRQNPELSITFEEAILLAYNRRTIGLFAKARQGFSRMSDIAGDLGYEIKARKLEIAGGILLTAAAAASACGGGSAERQSTNGNGGVKIEPAVTVTKAPEPSPTIAPTVLPTEAPKATIPAQADKFLNDLKAVASLNDEQRAYIRSNFESNWAKADAERDKWGSYRNVYSALWGGYNVTRDPQVKAKMAEIELYLKNTWPDFYQATVNDPNAWIR